MVYLSTLVNRDPGFAPAAYWKMSTFLTLCQVIKEALLLGIPVHRTFRPWYGWYIKQVNRLGRTNRLLNVLNYQSLFNQCNERRFAKQQDFTTTKSDVNGSYSGSISNHKNICHVVFTSPHPPFHHRKKKPMKTSTTHRYIIHYSTCKVDLSVWFDLTLWQFFSTDPSSILTMFIKRWHGNW